MEAYEAGRVHVQLRTIFIYGPSVHTVNNTGLKNLIYMKLPAYDEQGEN